MSVVSYGLHPLQQIKVFAYDPAVTKLVIFIHGGAWRDPNNTYDDFKEFAVDANAFGVNYRLLPEVKHPAHLEDVEAAIAYIKAQYGVSEYSVVGHSAGATLALQLRETPQRLFLLDGIYDLAELISEYPDYRSFVDEAFDCPGDSVFPFTSPATYVIIQSLDDELLSGNQSKVLMAQLDSKGIPYDYKVGHWGKHEEMYRNPDVVALVNLYL